MKTLIAAFMVLAMSVSCDPAYAWDVKDMNEHIDQTNFIVGNGCSGTLIDLEDRLVLTNHHCVANHIRYKTEEVVAPNGVVTTVRTTDLKPVMLSQRTYDGHEVTSQATHVSEIVAWDETLDLALLQFRSPNIPMTRQATLFTDPVYRGEVAWVVGNPLGMDNTVMRGVISSTNRMVQVGKHSFPYLQVDAGITGGNSGGALYNDNGQMIGVPGAAARGTVVGLAIPASFVVDFLDEFCRAYVYDATAPSYEECIEPSTEEEVE